MRWLPSSLVLLTVFNLTLFGLTLLGPARAETCEALLSSIPAAFAAAETVVMTTEIRQGEREFAHSLERLYKEGGVWKSEMLEQRGQRRPTESRGESAEPTFAFSCEGAQVAEAERGWRLTLPEQAGGGLPVREWTLSFGRAAGRIVPEAIAGDVEARFLFIPFRGSFSVAFSGWVLPGTAPAALPE